MTPETVRTTGLRIIDEMEKALVGKRQPLELLLSAFLAGGHVLFEDMPGLGKTLTARSLASSLGLGFSRIQFTPDLLPADITGGLVYSRQNETFSLRRGPLFADFVLADEINRASPRTQAALLEAMQEKHVTIDGQTHALPDNFTVVATQNPVEYEGTFPLPEAQLDRFMIRLSLGYPTLNEEQAILARRRERRTSEASLAAVVSAAEVQALRLVMEDVELHEDLAAYIVSLVQATRRHKHIAAGVSPRGALALQDLSRAHAVLCGRAFVIPDDIKRFVVPALAHRLVLEPGLWTEGGAAERILEAIVDSTPVPVLASTP